MVRTKNEMISLYCMYINNNILVEVDIVCDNGEYDVNKYFTNLLINLKYKLGIIEIFHNRVCEIEIFHN